LAIAAGDLDAAGLGRLADRDGEGEDADVVVGGDVLGIQGLAQEDLPGEGVSVIDLATLQQVSRE